MNKLENTSENKARFFALYWGQPVFIGHKLEVVNENYISPIYDSSILELSPLSQISDEDAEQTVQSGLTVEFFENGWKTKGTKVIFAYKPHMVDYLRSKGYALPWMGLSVDDLVSYGWVKLREVSHG
ncbi:MULTISPECIES: hypothetical protein [Olivibacter]|uniref:Uncharacterized protein n=1 Tax=Olivibacter jilunii TaxID=985016 RepID=A0ABW6AZ12_9SPHI